MSRNCGTRPIFYENSSYAQHEGFKVNSAPYRVTRYKESLYLTCLNAPRLGQQVIVYAAGAENTIQIIPWMMLFWKSPFKVLYSDLYFYLDDYRVIRYQECLHSTYLKAADCVKQLI